MGVEGRGKGRRKTRRGREGRRGRKEGIRVKSAHRSREVVGGGGKVRPWQFESAKRTARPLGWAAKSSTRREPWRTGEEEGRKKEKKREVYIKRKEERKKGRKEERKEAGRQLQNKP